MYKSWNIVKEDLWITQTLLNKGIKIYERDYFYEKLRLTDQHIKGPFGYGQKELLRARLLP